MFARRDPVPLGGWVDLEHMCPCAEDGLFPAWGEGTQWESGTPVRLRAKPGEAGAHLAVDIGHAGLGGLQGAARGVARAAGLASGVGGLVSVPPEQAEGGQAGPISGPDAAITEFQTKR